MTDDIPIMATVLSAHAVAETGGETEFSSAYAAYDDLTDEEKVEFEAMRVVHTFEAAQRLNNNDPTPEQLAMWRQRPSKTHPLVWTHASGRKSLVLGATTDHIVGWSREDSRAFLDELVVRVTKPERIYRHQWSVGDMVIWDNRGVLHRAAPYDPASPRDMHRCTLHGDEAIA
jgi:alpha-ketoglutarate-dependent taurine dioxygenase